MLLAWKILQQKGPQIGPNISQRVEIPESYFIGTEVIYEFRLLNKMDHLMNQKYRPLDEIREGYPAVVEVHLKGKFPEKVIEQLRDILEQIGHAPIIVRSSSLLEDNFGYSFAGKYDSYFCPNQGSPEENLEYLLNSIRKIYASTLNPDAILYRQKHQLIDYDERMAILSQTVIGESHGRYFFPTIAGVGFSRNNLRWNPKIRREDGFLRMVWGLGTRAVDRIENDYTRVVALSHPELRPETTAKAIRRYSQRYVDVIDLEDNSFKTLPLREVLAEVIDHGYANSRYIVSIDQGDYVRNIISTSGLENTENLLLTFDYLTKDRSFVKLMRTTLMRLEQGYDRPVDIEFTVDIMSSYPQPEYKLNILQCRPLSQRDMEIAVQIPSDLKEEDILFTSHELVPDGKAEGIRFIIFVDPQKYPRISDRSIKLEIGRAIGRLNKRLENRRFIMMGPGRWGSANIDLGVRLSYADFYNTKALIEIAVASDDGVPELSYGTHFYQDLVETGIHSLPLHLGDERATFNWDFFAKANNYLANLSPKDELLARYLKVVDVQKETNGRRLTILMDGSKDKTVGYLVSGEWPEYGAESGTVSTF
jgi:hypothetical protein